MKRAIVYYGRGIAKSLKLLGFSKSEKRLKKSLKARKKWEEKDCLMSMRFYGDLKTTVTLKAAKDIYTITAVTMSEYGLPDIERVLVETSLPVAFVTYQNTIKGMMGQVRGAQIREMYTSSSTAHGVKK